MTGVSWVFSGGIEQASPVSGLQGIIAEVVLKRLQGGVIGPGSQQQSSGGQTRAIKVMKKWECTICGFIYDEAAGWPEEGIQAGTPWEAVPDDWYCSDCGASKADFILLE